jgi:hypothetical protein
MAPASLYGMNDEAADWFLAHRLKRLQETSSAAAASIQRASEIGCV